MKDGFRLWEHTTFQPGKVADIRFYDQMMGSWDVSALYDEAVSQPPSDFEDSLTYACQMLPKHLAKAYPVLTLADVQRTLNQLRGNPMWSAASAPHLKSMNNTQHYDDQGNPCPIFLDVPFTPKIASCELQPGDKCETGWEYPTHDLYDFQRHAYDGYAQCLIDQGKTWVRPTKCDEGYRWFSDAERKQAVKGTVFEFRNLNNGHWVECVAQFSGHWDHEPHCYRVKLQPKLLPIPYGWSLLDVKIGDPIPQDVEVKFAVTGANMEWMTCGIKAAIQQTRYIVPTYYLSIPKGYRLATAADRAGEKPKDYWIYSGGWVRPSCPHTKWDPISTHYAIPVTLAHVAAIPEGWRLATYEDFVNPKPRKYGYWRKNVKSKTAWDFANHQYADWVWHTEAYFYIVRKEPEVLVRTVETAPFETGVGSIYNIPNKYIGKTVEIRLKDAA